MQLDLIDITRLKSFYDKLKVYLSTNYVTSENFDENAVKGIELNGKSLSKLSGIVSINLAKLIAPLYEKKAYAKNDIVIHEDTLYIANTAIASPGEDWTQAHWDEFTLAKAYAATGPGLVPAPESQIPSNSKFLGEDGHWHTVTIPEGVIVEEDLGNLVIGIYDEEHQYHAGDYCLHEKKLYKASDDCTGPWQSISERWGEPLLILDVIDDKIDEKIAGLGTVLHYVGDATVTQLNETASFKVNGAVYSVTGTAGVVSPHDDWDGNVVAGDEVAWSDSKSSWVYLGNITNLENYLTKQDLNNLTVDDYNSSSTYNLLDVVLYDRELYYCSTEIATAEVWTQAHWTKINLGEIFKGAGPGLVPPAPSDQDKVLSGNGWVTRLQASDLDVPTDVEIENLFNEE